MSGPCFFHVNNQYVNWDAARDRIRRVFLQTSSTDPSHLMFSMVSSGMGPTVCTAGRFLLVAPFTKLDEDEQEEAAGSVAPVETRERTRDSITSLYRGTRARLALLKSIAVAIVTADTEPWNVDRTQKSKPVITVD